MSQNPDHLNSSFYDSIQGLVSVGEPTNAIQALFEDLSNGLALPSTQAKSPPRDNRDFEKELQEAHALYESGMLYAFKKEFEQAIENLEKAYAVYLLHRHFLGATQCLTELALLRAEEDSPDAMSRANRLFAEAGKMIHVHMHEPGINDVRARLIHYQGLVHYREKRFGEAVHNFMYAKTFCHATGLEAAHINESMAVHYERTNDYHRAIQCLEMALDLKNRNGCLYEQAVSYQMMGRLYILREEYGRAAENLNRALHIAADVGDLQRVARIKNELIRLRIYENDIPEAQRLIKEVEQECGDRQLRVPLGQSLFYKAYIYYSHQELQPALDLLKQDVLPIFNRYGARKNRAMASRLQACIHYQMHRGVSVIEEMSEVIAIFKEEGEIAELAKTYYELGKIYLGLNEQKLALASMLEALRIAESNGLSFLISHIEDEIFRLDERKWQEIVDKRARHERVFEKEVNLLEALSSLESTEEHPERSPNKQLVSLLRVGQAMAGEQDLNRLLGLIKTETEQALEADRCTVFIYDRDRNELWSRVTTDKDNRSGESEEIRFPAHLGLAGYVVKTGEVLNIRNAYEDPRFNTEIDKKTGYRTRNILCVPMRNRRMEIIGVFQVLNKQQGYFTKVDEDLLMPIATQAGIAIENATLTREIKVSFDSFVKTLSSTIDARDPITAGHSERVADYATLLGDQMTLSGDELEALRYASLLHDIGKIGIREDILKKDGRLTEKEYRHIQNHVMYTQEILQNVHFARHLRQVPEIAASHHEKIDGTGYHRGLSGNNIPISGRILAIADVFDAITSRRHYRNRMAFDKVLSIMRRDAGTHFDAECVEHFFQLPLQSLGKVLLTDRSLQAVENSPDLILRLDRHVTVGEYYQQLSKDIKTKGEADLHRTFSLIYHQMEPDHLP
jgi:HD-GYP domain-containing protein (c-di-GMP phosphodiesterase class II)